MAEMIGKTTSPEATSESKRRSIWRNLQLASWPIHPYLFVLFFPSIMFYLFYDRLTLELTSRAFTLFFAGAVILHFLCWLGVRNLRQAGLVASVIIGLFYMQPAASRLFMSFLPTELAVVATIVVLLATLLFGIVLFRRMPSQWANLTKILNAAGLGMLVLPLNMAISTQFATLPESMDQERRRAAALAAQVDLGDETAPDIYHIVLDAYTRADVMKELYGFDNGAFVEDLRGLEFFVADQATGNYTQTLLSMGSTLSMRYLTEEFEEAAAKARQAGEASLEATEFRLALRSLINENALLHVLDSQGYHRLAVETAYPPILISSSDEILSRGSRPLCAFNLFEIILYKLFPLEVACKLFKARDNAYSLVRDQSRFALGQRAFDRLPRPAFVFQHLLMPHPPFVLNADGSDVVEDRDLKELDHPDRDRSYAVGYLDQVKFANTAVLKQITDVISQQTRPMIIVLHGDHGSGLRFVEKGEENSCFRERFSPLLAVYSTDGRLQRAMRNDLSLVNVYRVILNTYFGTNLEMLENRWLYTTWSTPAVMEPLDRSDLLRRCAAAPDLQIESQLGDPPAAKLIRKTGHSG
jgi:hypothetical protein